jgi:predicted lipoprotein with Yx(FWY)xxD motif
MGHFMTDTRLRGMWVAVPSFLVILLLAAACQAGGGATPTASAPASEAPASEAPASEAPTASASAMASEEAMADALVIVSESDLGEILTDADGNTLYLFTNDSPGESTCEGDCEANWPPLTVTSEDELVAAPEVTGELGTIERADGSLQVTINDVPLYNFSGDTAPGDTNGHEVGGVWFAVTADGTQAGGTSRVGYGS